MSENCKAAELVAKLNSGGWFVTGGHNVGPIFPKLPVIRAFLEGDTLKVETADRNFEAPANNIAFCAWEAEVRHTYIDRQLKKKIEGGGFREVTRVGCALRLVNPTIEEAARKARYEANRRRMEEELRKVDEELEVKKQAFVAKLTSEFVGKVPTAFNVDGGDLTITFEGGSTLSIALHGGDTWDAWIAVNEVSLEDFKSSW